MASLGEGQKDHAKALRSRLEAVIREAERIKRHAKRSGMPPQKVEVYIPDNILIRPDIMRRLKKAKVVISNRPLAV